MAVIFDCNVLINAFVFKNMGARQSWDKAISNDSVIISDEIFAEYGRIFPHEKFDKFVKLETRLEFIIEIQSKVKAVTVTHRVQACRDPKDDMYLELALSGNADCIITNDADLLALHPFEKISIITPKAFLEKF